MNSRKRPKLEAFDLLEDLGLKPPAHKPTERGKVVNKRNEATGSPIESDIPVNFKVVGRREWFDGALAPDAITLEQRVEIHNSSDLQPIKDWLNKQPTQGLGTVTIGKNKQDGLDPVSGTSKILLIKYGTVETVYLIEPELVPELKNELQSPDNLLVGHNLKRDFKFILSKYGFPLVRMYDTMLAEQVLTAGLSGVSVSLADLTKRYHQHFETPQSTSDGFLNLQEGDKFTREMFYSSARDVYQLFPVYEAQSVKLKKHRLKRTAKDEFWCIPVTAEMELIGINLDEPRLRAHISYFQERQNEIEYEVQKIYGEELKKKQSRRQFQVLEGEEWEWERHFDINSNQQKLQALKKLGYRIKDVKRETLENLGAPLGTLLAEYSLCQKMTSTYGQNLLDNRSPVTGRFHPQFHQMGQGDDLGGHEKETVTTATGRYSSNVQQIPRPETRYANIKNQEELDQVKNLFAEKLAEAVPLGSTGNGEPTFLGTIGVKEYYLFAPDKEHAAPYIQWRVPSVREAFRARPGYKWLIADYSQIEVKIMAELSGDYWLTSALNSGLDIHSFMASEIYGIPYNEFYKAYKNPDDPKHAEYSARRSEIKGVTFGVPYGAGPEGVAKTTGLPFESARDLIKSYFTKTYGLKAWLDEQGANVLSLGYARSLRGRKRFYRDLNAEEPNQSQQSGEYEHDEMRRQASNNPVQASCADVLKLAMVKIYLALRGGDFAGQLLYDAHIVLTMHDEVVVEAKKEQAEEVAILMKGCMEEAYDEIIKTVANSVEVTVADYWKK
jgi:DNA polymerase I-like protein with 3'-5' exonuclease and polymerase domains